MRGETVAASAVWSAGNEIVGAGSHVSKFERASSSDHGPLSGSRRDCTSSRHQVDGRAYRWLTGQTIGYLSTNADGTRVGHGQIDAGVVHAGWQIDGRRGRGIRGPREIDRQMS